MIATTFLYTLLGGLAVCEQPSDNIRLNQVGFNPQQEKIAVINDGTVDNFSVINVANGKKVLTAKPLYTACSAWSSKKRSILDFSSITAPGEYLLVAGADTTSFIIKKNALSALADGALKSFYYQRSGMPLEKRYAGKWSRPLGHADNHVMIHSSAVGSQRKEGDMISSSKGWYDAGDYNKYIVNSGYSIGLMQSVYFLFPRYFASQNVNIPESSNSTPDFLDEMYYNLSWMLTMQDPSDGGVYHKLTTPNFEGFIKPTDCKQQRYVVQKTVTAALDFAASMAQASRIFSKYSKDYPGFSKIALQAAENAYSWAIANPNTLYQQNLNNKKYTPAIQTGAYGDRSAKDELFWAASELYIATGNDVYRSKVIETMPQTFTLPTWGNTFGLGIFAWVQPQLKWKGDNAALCQKMKDMLIDYANQAVKKADNSAFCSSYGNSPRDFFWGCLSESCASQAISLVYAYELAKNKEFLTNAYRDMDYILGKNATGYCYVTGFGTKGSMNPHHRLSASDDIVDPIPGLLVGGPNPSQQDKAKYSSMLPDESYSDHVDSYASNEIAINWSATLVALASSLDALSK